MSLDNDGLMRRAGTSTSIEGGGLTPSKIEIARRFLDDEDEHQENPSNTPLPVSTNLSGSVTSRSLPFNQGSSIFNKSNSNNNTRRGTNRWKRFLCVAIFVGITLGCIWGIVALVEKKNGGGEEHIHEKRINEFHAEILELELSSKSDLETVGSPQYNAIQWLANVDGAKMKANNAHAMQRYALAVLFYSTSGTEDHVNPKGSWIDQNNWMTANGLCSWNGILCKGDLDDGLSQHSNNENGFVTVLQLPSNNLDGNLPAELCALTLLSKLDLSQNGLTGTLPKELAALHELRDLVLRENNLSGLIPTDYGIQMSNMRQLNLGVNRFNGPIPQQIEHMVSLRSLGLERNQFKGRIPDLEDMIKLTQLHLESNNLVGPFPASVTKLTSLVELNLSNNHLTGFLPSELAKLTRLEKIILNHLNLRGTLPSNLFKTVTRLTELSLQNNDFTGQIPTTIGHLKDIEGFFLGNNKFSGTIPRQVGLMADLRQFQIHSNEIGGTIPNIISALNNLEGIQLSQNSITGKIPSEIGNLHRLIAMHLESNQLKGEVPSEIGNIRTLKQARLYFNNLTGSIPEEVCMLTSDEDLTYLGADCEDGKITCDCCTKCF
mmetsp:Transcript_52952/g.59941  ORF Transcript_52952/g.59941 Transcript_52952/m.59941 type:complete len:604 (-) Transcript_52952:76-1887(-)